MRTDTLMRADRLLGENGVQEDNAAGRRQLEEALEQRRGGEAAKANGDWRGLRRGWCWGSQGFREELLERIGQQQGRQHYGEELRESDEQKAERLIARLLNQAGWTEADLQRRRKGDKRKAALAARVRSETTMTWAWIAERLRMGHWRTAANATRQAEK